jgi:hypothetical protein
MSIKNFMEEDHPAMFVSPDGKIGRIGGVSFVRIHVYVKEAPRWIPDRVWYWLADRITHTVNERMEK